MKNFKKWMKKNYDIVYCDGKWFDNKSNILTSEMLIGYKLEYLSDKAILNILWYKNDGECYIQGMSKKGEFIELGCGKSIYEAVDNSLKDFK